MMRKARNLRNVAQFSLPGIGTPAQLSLAPNPEHWRTHEVPSAPKPNPEKGKEGA